MTEDIKKLKKASEQGYLSQADQTLTKFENIIDDQKFVLNEHLILELEECFYEFEHIYTNYLLPQGYLSQAIPPEVIEQVYGALESLLKEAWDDNHSHMSQEQFDDYFGDGKQALELLQPYRGGSDEGK